MITQHPDVAPTADHDTIGLTIIYQDRATGLRAREFAGKLIGALGCEREHRLNCWRDELTDLPEIAREMADDAAKSEFVILSLCGNGSLSVSMKYWLESWLAAASPSASLIALFAPGSDHDHPIQSVRYYLRDVAQRAGIAFFAHAIAAPSALESAYAEGGSAPATRPFAYPSHSPLLSEPDIFQFRAATAAA